MAKCPVCGRTQTKKDDLIRHTEKEHRDEIPENMSTAQFIYFKTHGREYGLCRICGKPTEWNEKTGKPHQHCGSPACKEKIKQIARERMVKVYGKPSLMKDIEHQEKMLAHRKISGTYIWSDGKHKFTYTGQYEKFAIEWLDKVMDLDPEHIQMPGPVLPYEFNGEIKYWITDIYLEDFNLIIEIKAGKDENTHPGFEHNRELEAAKDASMRKQNVYNYTKITHKSMMNLVKVCSEIRMVNLFSEKENYNFLKEPIIVINESHTDGIVPQCKSLDKLFDFFRNKKCEIAYKKMPDTWKDSRKANGLPAPDELYEISYEGKIDGSICEILNNHGFSCYDKPRTSNPHYAKYKVDSLDNYKLDIYVNLISKRISISKFNTNYDGTSLTNTEIMGICESIMNEYTMSIANISPIVTNNAKYVDNESKEDTLLDRLRKVANKTKHEVIEPQDPQSNIFSPNNTVDAPDPLVASNNFVENEEVRVDLETDPYNTKPNDFSNISQSNIKSYF